MPRSCPRCLREIPEDARVCPFDGIPLDGHEVSTPGPRAFPGFQTRVTRFTGCVLKGRYIVHGFVSKGATARVYLAEDIETQTAVAVKMFAPTVALEELMKSRFLREAEVLKRIDHPNVVRVFDIGEQGDAPFLVMEALKGETLGERLARVGPLPLDVTLRWVRAAAEGLAATHKAGIIHRDVKPDNIFLVKGEQGDEIKLIDFGMARFEQEPQSAQGVVMGTAQYMAPEQIVCEPVDERTDVYALGVTMFRMLTGHLPFDVELGTDLLGHQLFSPAPPPSWLDEDLDPRFECLILSAMRKARNNRYPNMEAFLQELQREEPQGWPIRTVPDLYAPETDAGREASKFLEARFRLPA